MVPWRATADGLRHRRSCCAGTRASPGPPRRHRGGGHRHSRRALGAAPARGRRPLRPGARRRLAGAVRAASEGRTRLFIQLIDFLAISGGPPRQTYFARFLALTPRLRERVGRAMAHRERRGGARAPRGRQRGAAGRAAHRARARGLPLRPARAGHRRRTWPTSKSCRGCCPGCSPTPRAAARRPASTASSCTTRTRTRWRASSRRSNTRADGYGGPREQRVRLPLEVYGAVRRAVPEAFAVGCRFLADEIIEGGSRLDDAACFGVALRRGGPRLPLAVARREVRRREAAQGGPRRLPVHRALGARVHADADHWRRPGRGAATSPTSRR